METTKFDSILQDLDLDLWRVAVSVRGKSDPLVLPKVEIAHADAFRNHFINGGSARVGQQKHRARPV